MRKIVFLAGLGFGDEGKGSVVDFLTRKLDAKLIIRYNGGAQAAHHVVLPDGRVHRFAQFGSGSFVDGVRTLLSRHMLVNPFAMYSEAEHLESLGVVRPMSRVYVEREALVTTPFHIAANRIFETLRHNSRHGSCGMGIGETMRLATRTPYARLQVGDLLDEKMARKQLHFIQDVLLQDTKMARKSLRYSGLALQDIDILEDRNLDWILDTYTHWAKAVNLVDREFLHNAGSGSDAIIFEGAQGVLLDQDWGFHPHTTWTSTTYRNAYDLLETFPFKANGWELKQLGLLRSYMTRHGAGPMPTTLADNPLKDGLEHNGTDPWQQNFKVGHLDLPLLKYGIKALGGVDSLVVSHLDQYEAMGGQVCTEHSIPLRLPVGRSDTEERLNSQEVNTNHLYLCSQTRGISVERVSLGGLIPRIEMELGAPVSLISNGPTFQDKKEL